MSNKTKYLIGGGLVVVLVILAVIFGRGTPNTTDSSVTTDTPQTSQTSSKTPSTTSTVTTTAPKATTTPVTKPSNNNSSQKVAPSKPASESYTDALAKYRKSGYYIQFYPCQATPGSLIVKQGSRVMFDNRDSKAHVIAFKSSRYPIGAYNFAIATFGTIGTNYVTCDGGGSAVVTVVP